MFTGIVEELGTVDRLEPQGDAVRLTVRGPLVVSDVAVLQGHDGEDTNVRLTMTPTATQQRSS